MKTFTMNLYEKALKEYGALPMFMLLEQLQREEKYEHCQFIYEAIVENFTEEQLHVILNNAEQRIAMAREEALRKFKVSPDDYIVNINEYVKNARTMIGIW
tara:strand:+ start:1059 stop:1361 length:303 start_codon:yes stop_codon:yes gene_type:complete